MIHKCDNCQELKMALSLALSELEKAREQAAKATELMMKGEALRDRMMLGSILNGGFDTDEKKANMVYLLTGKRL
jgi:hypothetical protein